MGYHLSPQRKFARDYVALHRQAEREGLLESHMERTRCELRDRRLDYGMFSLKMLFEESVENGREIVELWNPRNTGGVNILEAGAVSTTDFSNITGQIVYSRVLDAFTGPELLWHQLFETIPTGFDGEKIAGIGLVGDEAEAIAEGRNYPVAGVNEEWVETPVTTKRGLIVPVTREAIFADRTSLVLRRASEVGRFLGVNKEKRCLDVALGISTVYRRNGGAPQATYGNSHTSGDFDNLSASNALVDWTSVESAELLFDAITDPNTGEPVDVKPDTIIVPTALKHTARRIVNATAVAYGAGGSTTPATVSHGGNPISEAGYRILSSQYVKQRSGSASTWYIGDPQRAFAYMENWPVTVVQAQSNSHDEFHRDIVLQFKASERGAAAVLEPRRMVKCTA